MVGIKRKGWTAPQDQEKNAYVVLGVARTSSAFEIRAAFLALARKHHPDVTGDHAAFAAISVAYDHLKTEDQRALYEAHLNLKFGSCGTCAGAGKVYRFSARREIICERCGGGGTETP
jgi:DnaJ-class molecular chaperone